MILDYISQEYGAERFVDELANKLRSGTYLLTGETERDPETGWKD
ncbi:hypothetical protein ACIOBL_11015 [Paenibacillus taichungensis]